VDGVIVPPKRATSLCTQLYLHVYEINATSETIIRNLQE
jgi:hypothetical protein